MPERVRFRTRLERDGAREPSPWVEAGNQRVASYPQLASGRYRFRVIAANDEGLWNETGATLAFELQQRFVDSVLFDLLCALGVVALVAGAVRLRTAIARRREAELQAQVEARTRELQDTRDQ